ncbi:MAG TPA: alpha-L-rhamnosidase C-terminal domain-containing protein [Terriglobales bacterium]|nr:alpha-L-rhamnosidase C-terminal domain-containing protein [Terriglobales bacterium]
MNRRTLSSCFVVVFITGALLASAQQWKPSPVDPTIGHKGPLQSELHKPLPEQYIWSTADAKTDIPRFLRVTFQASAPPSQATLYVAGPREAQVFLNGQQVGDFAFDPAEPLLEPPVFQADVARLLRTGSNTLAIRAVASVKAEGWMPEFVYTKGAVVAKIVPALPGVDRSALLITNADWKATIDAPSGWEAPGFNDSSWATAKSFGSIEGDIDFFQSRSDGGLYRWPGYDGISPFLMHLPLSAVAVLQVHGAGHFEGQETLTSERRGPLTVIPSVPGADRDSAPSLVLDFGREVNGRLEIISDSSEPARMTLQLGESFEEAIKKPFFGARDLYLPPGEKVYGPKSAFRYARLQFFGSSSLRLRSLGVDGIYYPVEYRGTFQSSDPLLNRIWEVGAHTAHLCMQDDIWDAPKRDRARWMGDLSVMGNVINHAFADHFLMEDTLTRLNPAPVKSHVNGIPGYSAHWVIGLADYYRQFGAIDYVKSVMPNLVGLLSYMEGDLDENSLFVNKQKAWPFVDWSQGMESDTPEAHRATHFEYYKAFRDGAFLLRAAGDVAQAQRFEKRAEQLKRAAQKSLLDPATKTFGPRWQSNALAVYSGIAEPKQQAAIHAAVFAALDSGKLPDYDITPYNYNFFLYAMSQLGDRQIALSWIRKYWGGMIAEGATSFWEGYDTRWPKDDFHGNLKADNETGYQASLSHGWSSGPTAWLMDNVLGVTPDEPGFHRVLFRPDLLDLESANGTVPAPQGPIHVDLKKTNGSIVATIDLPQGTQTRVLFPVAKGESQIFVNDKPQSAKPAAEGTRKEIELGPGYYVIRAQ